MNSKPPSQVSFAQAEYARKKKRTRRELFLEKMEQVVPWTRLMEVIEPHYPKSGKRGRPPIGLERMLRMYFVQQWYGLADEARGLRKVTQPPFTSVAAASRGASPSAGQ